MFFTPAAAVSVLGALSAFGVAEATYSNSNSNSYSNSNSGSKSCQNNYFWYDRLGCCLKSGGETTTPPSGNTCPDNFYWHTSEKCCYLLRLWFWWSPLNVCLTIGKGNASPPSGTSCPTNWSWLSSKSCCKPDQPDTPTTTPSCGNNWNWHPGKQCCVPGENTPTPSNAPGSYGRKRHAPAHKRTSFCPTEYESCPILDASGRSTESECIDTRTQLTSCGGCASIGKGQNCAAIPNAKVTTCQASRCVIEKCKSGYEVSGDKCVSQSHHAEI
ncbi:hypothetical protein B0J17DRAFT_715188 [Rhizoctonia solani]|nr:hypothetical protein B0J17DRAFT_715188 [Rhizoctonia solani]